MSILFDFGFFFGFVSDEHNPLCSCFGIVRFCKAVGPHIPVEDRNVDVGVQFLDLERILYRCGAASPAAVGPFFIPRSHTLNHHNVFGLSHLVRSIDNPIFQFKLRDNAWVFTVEIFVRLPFLSACGQDRCAMFNLPVIHGRRYHHPGREVSF